MVNFYFDLFKMLMNALPPVSDQVFVVMLALWVLFPMVIITSIITWITKGVATWLNVNGVEK